MAHSTNYICKIYEVDAIPSSQANDNVILEFSGSLKPSTKRKILKALEEEDYEIREKKMA